MHRLIDKWATAAKLAKKEVRKEAKAAKGRAEPEASGEPEGGGGEANDEDQKGMMDL